MVFRRRLSFSKIPGGPTFSRGGGGGVKLLMPIETYGAVSLCITHVQTTPELRDLNTAFATFDSGFEQWLPCSQHTFLGQYRPASEKQFEWLFAGGLIMARFDLFTVYAHIYFNMQE